MDNLRGCLDWTLSMIKVAGYWFPRNGNTRKTICYAIYSTVVITCSLLTYILTQIAYIVSIFGQLDEMIKTLFLLLTHLTQSVKVATFICKRKQIYDLLDCMEQDLFRPRNSHQLENALRLTKHTNTLAKILVCMVIMCCTFCCLSALVEKTDEKTLPVNGLFPFDTKNSPQYELISVCQVIVMMGCGCANAAMDMIAAAFISQICIQYDIVSDSLLHIKDFAELKLKTSSKVEDYHTIPVELEDEMRTILIECIRHHLKIKEFAANVQSIFNLPLFVQFLTAVATICTTLFALSQEPMTSFYFWELLLYIGCMLVEIAIFCWYGNDVIFKCKKLPISLYHSEWVKCSHDYKKILVIAMLNMQEELCICVGGVVNFSLDTLVVVLKSAWSYFLVLNRISE